MQYPVNREMIKSDLFQAVNGAWLEQAVIPDDKPSTGGFQDLADAVETTLMADLVELAKNPSELTPLQAEMVKYHQLALDTKRRDERGMAPVNVYLEKIKAIKSVEDLTQCMIDATLTGMTFPIRLGVQVNMADSTQHQVSFDDTSLIVPDKGYYDPNHPQGQVLLQTYREVATELLMMTGFEQTDAEAIVADGMDYDALLAPATYSSEERAEYTVYHNPHTVEDVASYSSIIDFKVVLAQLIQAVPEQVNVTNPRFYRQLNELFKSERLNQLKAWMIMTTVFELVPYLTQAARQVAHRYHQLLTGNPAMRSVEKAAYSHVNAIFMEVIGNYYAERYFGEAAKRDVESMIQTMIGIYQQRLLTKEWLSVATREAAVRKLDAMDVLVGYPETIRPLYQQFVVGDREFFEATFYFNELAIRDNLAKWNRPVDRKLWHMGANLVNAYFDPFNNLICFPAAILQAPFYSLAQSASANYGGIGAVIAHEISHAFDNNGAKFDEKGNLANWWTEEDFAHFDQLADQMIELWDGLETEEGPINGTLTVSENIADAGGLSCALEATQLLADPDLEAFFFNWARIWCRKARPEYKAMLLQVDVHSPGEWRANMAPKNLAAFYETFNIVESDPMYLAPEKRVNIW